MTKVCDGYGGWLEPNYDGQPGYEASEITCVDLDNDCDGEIDELYLAGGLFTYTDLDGSTGLTKGDVCSAEFVIPGCAWPSAGSSGGAW